VREAPRVQRDDGRAVEVERADPDATAVVLAHGQAGAGAIAQVRQQGRDEPSVGVREVPRTRSRAARGEALQQASAPLTGAGHRALAPRRRVVWRARTRHGGHGADHLGRLV